MNTISTAFTRPTQLVGGGERQDRLSQDDADHVEAAADGERNE